MKRSLLTILQLFIMIQLTLGQSDPFEKLHFLLGSWDGAGEGFGNSQSTIESDYRLIMDGKYIEARNESWFSPTKKNPEGEHHVDKGYFSFDINRQQIVYRQFNNEGYINQYILVDSLSNDSMFVFETESIENFIPGGRARWTISKLSGQKIKTVFDVSSPDREYICLGSNLLEKSGTNDQSNSAKVTGIGGIFFKSENPTEICAWYGKNLGLAIDEYGSVFEFRNANRPDEINYLRWGPFSEETDYFSPSEKPYMINYRVSNLTELVDKLTRKGVTILDEIETYEYGKFVHILDPEGNKIELWEPVDRVLTKMGGNTTK